VGEVKTLRVKGEVQAVLMRMTFAKEIRALSVEEAVEKVYDEICGKHKLKRSQIKILSIEEIDPRTAKNPLIVKISKIGEQA